LIKKILFKTTNNEKTKKSQAADYETGGKVLATY